MMSEKSEHLSVLDWLLIVLLLLSLSGFCWYWYQSKSLGSVGIGPEFTAHWSNVLVIDMTTNSDLSEAAIMRGEDLVLLAPSSLDTPIVPTNLSAYVSIQNLLSLGLLTPLVSNIFTPQDPVFAQLKLLVYDSNGMKASIIPLYRAGIRAIELYRGRLMLRARLNNIETKQVVGYVIVSDGTQRTIHLVPVHDHLLQGPITLVNG